jgi:hypothetical protein
MYPGNIENFRDRTVCQASNPCTSITDDSSRLSSDPIHQDLEEEKQRLSFNILIKKMSRIVYAPEKNGLITFLEQL